MTRTVDLVICGASGGAVAAATDALLRGGRILVLLPSADPRVARRLRRSLCRTALVGGAQVSVMTNAAVVCVDGVHGVEAVVIRHGRKGRLWAVNASGFLSCGSSLDDDDPVRAPSLRGSRAARERAGGSTPLARRRNPGHRERRRR